MLPATGLRDGVKSFQVDGDHLPQLPDGVAGGSALDHRPPRPCRDPHAGARARTRARTRTRPDPARAGAAGGLGRAVGRVRHGCVQVFKATGVALSMAFTSGVRTWVMALTPRRPSAWRSTRRRPPR